MGEPGTALPKAKKPPRPGPPPPPPAVCAGALAVRVATAKAFGIPSPTATLQATWVTEPGSGKVTMTLDASRRAPFPKETWAHAAMLDMIERDVKKLAGCPVRVFEFANGERFAAVNGVLVECPTPVAATVPDISIVGRVSVDEKKKPDTMVLLAGKKKNVSVKFSVSAGEDVAVVDAAKAGEGEEESLRESSRSALESAPIEEVAPPALSEDEQKTVSGDAEDAKKEMIVDPFQVVGNVDYDKLVEQFGSQKLNPELLERFRAATIDPTKSMHRFLRRGIFFSHRDLDKICGCVEANIPFYLYTGRGPSSAAMHLGHLVPFMMTQWLQEAFGVPLVIQMTDDEKFLWKGAFDETKREYNLDYYRKLTRENAKDIIACGFDKERTFIFSDCDYLGHMYPNIAKIWKSITYNTAKAAFGFDPQSNIGQSAFPAIQAAPSFATSFEIPLRNVGGPGVDLKQAACLIPCAIDQDPYFRLTRDVAPKLAPTSHKLQGKPALVHSKFFPPLQGAEGKMSSSNENSAIFLTDTPEQIESKIKTHAFSGGGKTKKEQEEHGANLDVDVSYQWLRFFLEDDDLLKVIGDEYGSGKGEYGSTKAVKAKLVEILQDLVAKHKARRDKVTEEEVDEWMAIRPLAPPLLRSRTSSS